MPRVAALLLVAIGAALVAVGLRHAARAREAAGWTRTPGRVLESRVERLDPTDEQPWERYALVLRYAYEARGRTRESRQLWIGSTLLPPEDHPGALRRWAERFPAGSEPEVWFDPADPDDAVLVRRIPRGQVAVVLSIGGVLLFGGLYALWRRAWP